MPEDIEPTSGAQHFRASTSTGSNVIESTSIYNKSITPETIAEINRQKQTGDFRTIAGRPWWVSTFSTEELKKAGLI